MLNMAKRLISTGLDLVYPQSLYCICCGKIIDESRPYRLCNECMDGIKWIGSRTCRKCGKRLADINPTDTCFSCREHPHTFDKGYTCTEYGTHERAIVFALKYDGRADIAETVGEILFDRMTAEFSPGELFSRYDIVLSVPIHNNKKVHRGFNQAALIASSFSEKAGLSFSDNYLIRILETHIMRSLGPLQRKENIRGAFKVNESHLEDLFGRSVLLIDDIYTTGATSDEIAQVLKSAGTRKVDILTFAAGADMIKN